ncbi:MAG: hypothetical protein KBC62_00425 [Candidatus Pacebacteria bacterium]|nr:hypothetical protein [Candidatus Paceibacterota bacterium]
MGKKIIIKRVSGYADRMRPYVVMLDGKAIGEVANNQTVELYVDDGIHSINMKIDWCRSNIVNFKSDKDITEFECGSNLKGFKIILAIFFVIFLRDKYLWLKQVVPSNK